MERTVFIFGFVCFGVQTAVADPVSDVCLAYNQANVCECATEALKDEIGHKNYVYYTAASATALEHQSEGSSLVDAWDIATTEHAIAAGVSSTEALNQMNAFGSAHRDAIKKCEG